MFRTLFSFLLFAFPLALSAQNCDDCRYISHIFDSVEVSTEEFGMGVNADGVNQQLFMDIYRPHGDTVTNRPLMIFAFGGGFIQGSRDEDYVVRGCKRFARAGYVAAAIDYRIGFSIPGLFPSPTEELMRVFFRAMQDMRASIQWFRHDADQGNNIYAIDPDRIFAGGASAGAITAVMMTYCEDSSEFAEIGSLGALSSLGTWNSSSGPHQNYDWMPQGVFNIAGAIVNTDWIEAGDPPIISVHGDEDAVVPYQGGNIDFGFVSLGLEGSYNVDAAARDAGVCSYLYTIEGGDHPSGGASEEYFDGIFLRSMPRAHAIVHGRSFCCSLEVDVQPEDIVLPGLSTDPVLPNLVVSNDSGAAQTWHCVSSCTPGSTNNADDIYTRYDEPLYMIGMVREGNCQNTDFSTLNRPFTPRDPELTLTDFEVFPNPASNEWVLRMGSSIRGPVTVRVTDLQGALLHSFTTTGPEYRQPSTHLPAGTYFLELRHKNQRGIKKLMVH